jgi:hypothetical protein
VKHLSVLHLNSNNLTARQYAQKVDRFKYHRVVKLLRDLEIEEQNKAAVAPKITSQDNDDDDAQVDIDYNRMILMGLCLGLVIFIIDCCVRLSQSDGSDDTVVEL